MKDFTLMMPPPVREAWKLVHEWADEEGYRARIVTPREPRNKKRKEVPTLDAAQVDAIFRAISKREVTQVRSRALVALLEASGLRIGEALALDVEDIDRAEPDVWRVTVPCEDGCKTGARVVPILAVREGNPTRVNVELSKWLDRRFPVGDKLFNTSSGEKLTYQGFRRSLVLYGKRAGVDVTPHMFRHTYATNLMRAGADVAAVQMLLGHADGDTTARYYLHADERRMNEVVRLYT